MPTLSPQTTPFYGGGQVLNPANVKQSSGTPPTTLTQDKIGTIAIDPSAANAWILAAKSGGVDTWIAIGGGALELSSLTGDTGTAIPLAGAIKISGGTGSLSFAGSGSTLTGTITPGANLVSTLTGTSGGALSPTAGNITVTAIAPLTVTGSGSTLTISGTALGFVINSVAGASQALATANQYVSNSGSLCTFTLPATAAVGDAYWVVGAGAGGWKIAQNASQVIHLNSTASTTGTGGSVASTNQWNSILIMCVATNTTFSVVTGMGTYTFV